MGISQICSMATGTFAQTSLNPTGSTKNLVRGGVTRTRRHLEGIPGPVASSQRAAGGQWGGRGQRSAATGRPDRFGLDAPLAPWPPGPAPSLLYSIPGREHPPEAIGRFKPPPPTALFPHSICHRDFSRKSKHHFDSITETGIVSIFMNRKILP